MSQGVNITIGGSLNALQWAYQRGTRLIINKLSFPPPYEPPSTKLAWGLLYYKLMMDGRIIGGDTVNAIKINDDNVIIACNNNVTNKLVYQTITLFDDENIIGLPDIKQYVDEYITTDVMSSVSFVFKDKNFSHQTEDDLVNQIHVQKEFVNSPARIWAVSRLNEQQLKDFDYSDTMAKFKTESELKKMGFTGNFTNRDEITLKVESRIIKKKMNIYDEAEKIKFVYV